MNYYSILKLNSSIKSPRIKFLGLYLLHITRKRYLSVHFDPVNACNLRCKMCYFTDTEYVQKLKGIFDPADLPLLSKAILKRALKLQVGCGTEPTLYKHLDTIFELASKAKVPYISMTTNANLLEKSMVEKWAALGLKEITISLHGVQENTYHEMMSNGDYRRFMNALQFISEIKIRYPSLKLRVNYTFNTDNFDELKDFWNVFGNIKIDILQIRPITKIGNTEYNNFSLDSIIPKYETVYNTLRSGARERNAIFLAPRKEQLTERTSHSSVIHDYTYCYISPTYFWRNDFSWKEETFDAYAKRTSWAVNLLKMIFASKQKYDASRNNKLNYDIL